MRKMSTGELQIAERAKKHKGEALHSLHHFTGTALLKESYRQLNKKSAAGVDGENWYEFGKEATVRIPVCYADSKQANVEHPGYAGCIYRRETEASDRWE